MGNKFKAQQYFYLRSSVGRKLNSLETEIDNYLYREDRIVFDKPQELSRWLEKLDTHCKSLSTVHKRCPKAAVIKCNDTDQRLTYRLTNRLVLVIYKSKI